MANNIEYYLSSRFRGVDRHACEPAGRGTVGDRWMCEDCGADWKAVTATKAGVTTRTWERA